jgi:glycosyltransferase involved in cell wall biosynthesis
MGDHTMPNIAVMELHADIELIYSEAALAKYCNATVTIFTTKFIYDRVVPHFNGNEDNYTWILQKKEETLKCFLKRIEKYCDKKIDLLLMNTCYVFPHQQIFYYLFRPKCKIVQVACRVEYWFGEWQPINCLTIKSFIISITNNIGQFIRKRALSRYDGLWVENKEASNYAISSGYKRKVACVPVHFYTGVIFKHEYKDKLRCITIGTITDFRRDYSGLLDAFEKLFESGKREISLTLLGGPVDKKGLLIIERCKKLIEKGLDINFFTEYVPEDVLDKEISAADIIINPNYVTMYGRGTFGAIMKAMQFAKPGIYPANSLFHEDLTTSSLFYNKIEELPAIIENLLANPERVKELSQNAIANSEKFSLEVVANKFNESVLKDHLID